MRWNTGKVIVCATLASALAVPVAGQDWVGRGRAHGEIVDEQGDPIEGAKVTLHLPGRPEAGPEPQVTKKNGRWAFGGLLGGDWTVVIEKEGYMVSEGSFRVNEFAPAPALRVELTKSAFAGIQEGQSLVAQGRYAEARERFQEVLPKMDPVQQAQLHALIGTTHYHEKSFEAAIEEYETALPSLAPEDQVSVRLRLGDAYLQLGRHAEARATYEQSLANLGAEGRSQVLLAIARSYDVEGDRKSAIATVQRILETHPEDVRALQLIADLLGREGREEEAQTYLDRIPESAELPPDMLLNQGIRFYNDGELDQAIENFDRVIAQDPEHPDAYYYRGLAKLGKEELAAAKIDLAKYMELAPEGPYAAEVKEFLDYLEDQ